MLHKRWNCCRFADWLEVSTQVPRSSLANQRAAMPIESEPVSTLSGRKSMSPSAQVRRSCLCSSTYCSRFGRSWSNLSLSVALWHLVAAGKLCNRDGDVTCGTSVRWRICVLLSDWRRLPFKYNHIKFVFFIQKTYSACICHKLVAIECFTHTHLDSKLKQTVFHWKFTLHFSFIPVPTLVNGQEVKLFVNAFNIGSSWPPWP